VADLGHSPAVHELATDGFLHREMALHPKAEQEKIRATLWGLPQSRSSWPVTLPLYVPAEAGTISVTFRSYRFPIRYSLSFNVDTELQAWRYVHRHFD
jgi:hypothetical protein